jgi:hypothetical protein
MKTAEIESDIVVLHRLARMWLDGTTRIVIDQRGITITVPTDAAARRITESHGLRRATTLVQTWVGMVGEVVVTVTVEQGTAPIAPRQRAGTS